MSTKCSEVTLCWDSASLSVSKVLIGGVLFS